MSAINPATVQGLAERGHVMEVIEDSYQDFGAGQFIWRLAIRRRKVTSPRVPAPWRACGGFLTPPPMTLLPWR